MITVAKFHIFPANFHRRTTQSPPCQLGFFRSSALWDSTPPYSGRRVFLQPCRSFRTDEGKDKGRRKNVGDFNKDVKKCLQGAVKSLIISKDSMVKLEENLARIALHLGRYIVTMMSTGVILLIGFSLSGGDGQMNDLVWYSWLGGIIIGTMIGSNMVLDEVSRAGPRNVVITGRYPSLIMLKINQFLVFIMSKRKISVSYVLFSTSYSFRNVFVPNGGMVMSKRRHFELGFNIILKFMQE